MTALTQFFFPHPDRTRSSWWIVRSEAAPADDEHLRPAAAPPGQESCGGSDAWSIFRVVLDSHIGATRLERSAHARDDLEQALRASGRTPWS